MTGAWLFFVSSRGERLHWLEDGSGISLCRFKWRDEATGLGRTDDPPRCATCSARLATRAAEDAAREREVDRMMKGTGR